MIILKYMDNSKLILDVENENDVFLAQEKLLTYLIGQKPIT